MGVRAHYIDVSTDLAEAKNSSVMQTDRLLEQQFESELVLKYSTEMMSLRILMDKEKAEQFAQHEQFTHYNTGTCVAAVTCIKTSFGLYP